MHEHHCHGSLSHGGRDPLGGLGPHVTHGEDAVKPENLGLKGNWALASDEQIISRWDWDWSTRWWFRRREFRKTSE